MDYDRFLLERLKRSKDAPRDCCNDVHNLRYAVDMNRRKDQVVLRCKHCHRLHYRMYTAPGNFGLKS